MATRHKLPGHALMESLLKAQERAAAKQRPRADDREVARLRQVDRAARDFVEAVSHEWPERGDDIVDAAFAKLREALWPGDEQEEQT